MLTGLLNALSPSGPRGRLSILIFHRVLERPDPLFADELDAHRFDAICGWLKGWFNVLPLDEAVRRMKAQSLPTRALSITFDDGYADNHDIALPILMRHGLPATFFIATGFLDGGRMWNDTIIEAVRLSKQDQMDMTGTAAHSLGVLPLTSLDDRRIAIAKLIGSVKYLPTPKRNAWCSAVAQRSGAHLPGGLMMRSDHVRALHSAGMCLGGHTVNHPILASMGPDDARDEIAAGRRQLEDIVGKRIGLFAYPNGRPDVDYGTEAVRIVRDLGFDAAVSTAWGSARNGDDYYQLPRFTPWDRTRARFGMRMVHHLWST